MKFQYFKYSTKAKWSFHISQRKLLTIIRQTEREAAVAYRF